MFCPLIGGDYLETITVLFIIKSSALNRGMNTGLENLAWGLAERGIKVHILSGGCKPDYHSYKIPKNVTYYFTGFAGNPESFTDRYLEITRKESLDAVIGWIKNIAPLTHLKMKHNNKPIFIANQGSMTHIKFTGWMPLLFGVSLIKKIQNGMNLSNALSILMDKSKYYSRIDKIISISRTVQANSIDSYRVNPSKCSVIPRGIDIDLFWFKNRNYTIINRPARILYAGNVIESKGVGDLVDAVAYIKTPIDLIFCGNGNQGYFDSLKNGFKPLNRETTISFLGALKQKELITQYQRCDIFVFPSRGEGLGKVLLEAMACGCPVVVSDISPFKEIIIPQINGLMVPVRSPEKLAHAIQDFIADPELCAVCSINARKTIETRFSKKAEIDQWYKIIFDSIECHECVDA